MTVNKREMQKFKVELFSYFRDSIQWLTKILSYLDGIFAQWAQNQQFVAEKSWKIELSMDVRKNFPNLLELGTKIMYGLHAGNKKNTANSFFDHH